MKNTARHTWHETEPPSPDTLSEWHHIALVLSSNNYNFEVYHDGTKKGTRSLDNNKRRTTGTGNVIIGSKTAVYRLAPLDPTATTTAGSPYLSGSMNLDELTMWNKALSSIEVNQIKNAIP